MPKPDSLLFLASIIVIVLNLIELVRRRKKGGEQHNQMRQHPRYLEVIFDITLAGSVAIVAWGIVARVTG